MSRHKCNEFLSTLHLPRHPAVNAAVRNATARAVAAQETPARRVWDLTPFGYELPMLMLRFRTLEMAVDGFLVTESTTTHTNNERKPAVLTEALSSNRTLLPDRLLAKIHVRVLDFAKEKQRFCPTPNMRCFEALQRFVLLEMLFKVAAPEDLALVGDTDEFARPSVVNNLRLCYPFDAEARLPDFVVLRLTLFKFGVHCDHGNTFELGTRAFSVGTLLGHYGSYRSANAQQLGGMSAAFTATRSRTFTAPVIPNAGWHLTSLGTSFELARKLRTFLHSNIFNAPGSVSKGSLDEMRLERCMKYCLELDKPASVPPCLGRSDPRSRPLPGTLRTALPAGGELPRELVHHRSQYPTAWFRFLPSVDPDLGARAASSRVSPQLVQ